MTGDDEELYRREAIGAFAHELRTPLTSIRMVLELAKRQGTGDGQLTLDGELAGMLLESVDGLQQLADDLQETSRLERRKGVLRGGPGDLRLAVAEARTIAGPDLRIRGEEAPAIDGPWDQRNVAAAIAGFARSADRIGEGNGEVELRFELEPERVRLSLESGRSRGAERAIAADAGYGFFRARQVVLSVGGTVECARHERHCRIVVDIPR